MKENNLASAITQLWIFLNPVNFSIPRYIMKTSWRAKRFSTEKLAGRVFLTFHWKRFLPQNINTPVAAAAVFGAGAFLWME